MFYASRRLCFAISFATLVAVGLTSCANPIKGLLVTRATQDKQMAALRGEYEGKLAANRTQTETATKAVIAAKDAQMVGAGGSLYAADMAFRSILAPTRTDLVINNRVNEAWTALGRPMPSAEDMLKEQRRLAEELDSTKTSLAQLQSNHAAAMAQNQALADATKKHAAELAAAEAARLAVVSEFSGKLDVKQREVIETQGRLIALEKERADDRAALQALKTKMSVVLGLVALAAIAGAVYLPVFRQQCGVFGAVCGLCSIGIWYLQPWHVAVGAGVGILGVIGWMVLKHSKEEKLSDSLVLAMNRVKEQSAETWAKVSPVIADQLGKYVKRDGKTVVRPDPAMEHLIDSKLAEYQVLGAAPTVVVTAKSPE